MQITTMNGYTSDNYADISAGVTPIILLGDGLRKRYVYVNDKKTNDIRNMIAMCYYPGHGIQQVFLPAAYTQFPKELEDMAEVELVNPTAYINRYGQVYVQADGLKAKEA